MEKKFIEKFKEAMEIEDHEVAMADEFRKYEEWSSLAYLSLIAMMDEEFDTQIEESDFRKIRTVGELFNAVNK